jgi:hypothetical protein
MVFHVICTLRSKQAYVLSERNGKHIPEKIGLKPVQRDDMDYELTLVFQLTMQHLATAIKDRTEIFGDKPEFHISIDTGRRIKEWCEQSNVDVKDVIDSITDCPDIPSLKTIFDSHPLYQESLRIHFNNRKQQLLTSNGQHRDN